MTDPRDLADRLDNIATSGVMYELHDDDSLHEAAALLRKYADVVEACARGIAFTDPVRYQAMARRALSEKGERDG